MLGSDRKGIESFDEIIALIVVVITIGTFIATSVTLLNASEEDSRIDALERDCDRLLASFLSYNAILVDAKAGIFSLDSLQGIAEFNINNDLSPPEKYMITIKDVSHAEQQYDTVTYASDTYVGGDVIIKSSPCLVVVGDEYRPSKISVFVWR